MRLVNADAFKEQVAVMTLHGVPVDKANAMLKLIDMQPTVVDIDAVMMELDRRVNTQLKIIAGLRDPVYRYGFTKSLEAYQQCRLILEELVNKTEIYGGRE